MTFQNNFENFFDMQALYLWAKLQTSSFMKRLKSVELFQQGTEILSLSLNEYSENKGKEITIWIW